MNIDALMQGITDQNLAKAELINLKAENDQLKARVKYLEANQYESGKYLPIYLAEAALDAQKKYYESELQALKKQ
jgi:cell division protein FtsB